MRCHLVAVFFAFLPLPLVASETEQESQQAEIAKFIEQLSDKAFDKREAATKRLTEIGRPAIPALHRAAQGASLETRLRAMRVLEKIDPAMRNFAALSSLDLRMRTAALGSLAGYRIAVLIPKLLQLLEHAPARPRTDDERDYVQALLAVVGFQQDGKATPGLARLLLASGNAYADPDEQIVLAMAQIADSAATDALLKYIDTRHDRLADTRLNEALADALGGTRDPRSVAPILDLMEQPYEGRGGMVVQQAAIRGLAKIGSVAVSRLAREYPRRRAFTKRSIATVLGEIGGDEAKEVLGTLLNDMASYEAAVSLDRLGDPRGAAYIRDELERLMKDSKPVPQELCNALSQSHSELPNAVCRQLLESRDRGAKWAAAESLARQEDDAGLHFLRKQLEDQDKAARAIGALVRVGDNASTKDIARLAHHRQQDIVQAAIRGLAELNNREAASALLQLAKGPRTVRGHAELRRDSTRALAAYPAREVMDLLVELLSDDDERVVHSAYMALSEIVGATLVDAEHWRRWWSYNRREYSPLAAIE